MDGYITANQVGLGATADDLLGKARTYAGRLGLDKYLDKLGLTPPVETSTGTPLAAPVAEPQPEPEAIPTWGKVALGLGAAFLIWRAIR